MAMRWHDVLFAHWPVRPDILRPLIPRSLELDTFDSWAWIGVVPFHMSGVRLRYLPECGCSMAFPELNVRTYVKSAGRNGVWFFSLDAMNRLAVRLARSWYGLPYYHARMDVQSDGEHIRYQSTRTHHGAPAAQFVSTSWRDLPGSLRHTGALVDGAVLPVYGRSTGTARIWRHPPYALAATTC
jgi:uncharacterized protein YqjF (DUF2071 family)